MRNFFSSGFWSSEIHGSRWDLGMRVSPGIMEVDAFFQRYKKNRVEIAPRNGATRAALRPHYLAAVASGGNTFPDDFSDDMIR